MTSICDQHKKLLRYFTFYILHSVTQSIDNKQPGAETPSQKTVCISELSKEQN